VTKKERQQADEEFLRILSDPRLVRKLQTRFLQKLAHTPREKWTDYDWQLIRSADDEFWKRLCSATTDLVKRHFKNPPPDDRWAFFLPAHWEALRCPNPDKWPGLREWEPPVVLELLRKGGLYCGGRKWFEKRRQELHLTPKLPYTVTKLPGEPLLPSLLSSVPDTRYTYLRL
jgi:hypothetical protein